MKERLITGILLAVVVGCVTYFSSWQIFAAAFFIVMMLAAFEWSRFIHFSNAKQKKIFFAVYALSLVLSLALLVYFAFLAQLVLIISSLFWLMMPFLLIKAEKMQKLIACPYALSAISIVISAGFFIALVLLKQAGEQWVFILIGLVASADSFAYFFGRKLGKHKLAATISPGKSIEGVVAGLIMTTLIALILAACLSLNLGQYLGFVALAILASVISVAGDLFESLIKRHCGVKDSGNILPGHGGILDRIDGLSAVAPIFALGLGLFSII